MPNIRFSKKNRADLTVETGANLMKALLDSQVPVASSCHGDGVCAKCRIQVTQGDQNLSRPNETEIFLKEKFQLKAGQRISCQVTLFGDVEIDASYW